MEFGVFLIWNCVGDAKFSKTNPLRMAWCFCWQIIKKGLEGCSIVHFGLYGRRETRDILKAKRCLIKCLNSLFFVTF